MTVNIKAINDPMASLHSLCTKRGLINQSSEIYGGLKGAYDFVGLGVELKNNIKNCWWENIVSNRDNVVGLDSSILMNPKVWEASGHLEGFNDPLVDCFLCKERFRSDKARKHPQGTSVEIKLPNQKTIESAISWVRNTYGIVLNQEDRSLLGAVVGTQGYVCPCCNSPFLSEERSYNLMFRSSFGPVDPIGEIAKLVSSTPNLSKEQITFELNKIIQKSAIYLRPETAQAMFVNFKFVLDTYGVKIPFGIAQIGRSFRNEITTSHYLFRLCEFEQMEMEFFCNPEEDDTWHKYWTEERLKWWKEYANTPENFRIRKHDKDELAHYSKGCNDIDYNYPWGFDELEGISNRGNYDLTRHSQSSKKKLDYFDTDLGKRYIPHVIEPAAGLTRGVLAYLLDAMQEEYICNSSGNSETRTVLRLNPKFSPIKVGIFPLEKKAELQELARNLAKEFRKRNISVLYEETRSIGKRYRRQDEIGTPFCITIDFDSLSDGCVTIRDRDTMQQVRMSHSSALDHIISKL